MSRGQGWFEIHRSDDPDATQPFWWRAMARNGRIFAPSETFTRKSSAKRSVKAFAKAFGIEVVEIKDLT